MSWFKEMETPEWQAYADQRIEEEAQHYAEYLQEKQVRDFEDFVAAREREASKGEVARSGRKRVA